MGYQIKRSCVFTHADELMQPSYFIFCGEKPFLTLPSELPAVYQSGHMPTGWEETYPEGKSFVY